MRERSEQLKRHLHELLYAGVRRTTFYPLISESLGRTKGEPRPLRRAKAFAHLLDHVKQAVHPHERLAGSIAGMWPLAEDLPSFEERLKEARQVVEGYLRKKGDTPGRPGSARWALMARDHFNANVTFEDLQRLAQQIGRELEGEARISYAEIYRELENHFNFDYGQETRHNFAELPWFASNHLHLKYEKALVHGLGGLRRQILEKKAAAAPEKIEFYESTLIAVDATIRFIRRYAETLRAEAAKPETEKRQAAELRDMAAVCEAVAEAPPRSFREAIQLVWLLHVIANAAGGAAMSFGRFDQYLYPFYRKDIEAGAITRDEAQELVECLWLKVNGPNMRTVQSLSLGGVRSDGEDGTNDLTYVCLDAAAACREPYPNTCVRVHRGSPEALWDKIVESLLSGCGQPMIFNDDEMIPNQVRRGYPLADAREYYPMGCVEIMLAGLQPSYKGEQGVRFPGLIELALSDGRDNEGNECGPRTGEPASFHSFEEFLEAALSQTRARVRSTLQNTEAHLPSAKETRYDPFASILVDDCLENGVDVCQGGARYPRSFTMNSVGFGTAVDSLCAIKTFVFDRGQLTLPELKDLLDRNFAGGEQIRQLLAKGAPAFGNDDPEADEIAVRLYDAFADTIWNHQSKIGALHSPQMFSYTDHVRSGEMTAASANGRLRGATLSDALGPSQGRDVRGPTSLINSVTRLKTGKLIGGCAFNMKISPDLARSAESRRNFKALLRTHVRKGGLQIQINMIDQEALRKAQKDPDQHRDIIVRVAGYSERFTSLDRKLQDEIIQRTSQGGL